jgi:hypothetical protein
MTSVDPPPGTAPGQQPAHSAAAAPESAPGRPAAVRHQRIALVDLLDRVLARGVVVTGDVTLAIADVDLVTISLRALVSSVRDADVVPGLAGEGPGQ